MTNVTSSVAPMTPVPTVAPVLNAPPPAEGNHDFAKLVNQQLQAAGQPAIPQQTLAQVLAPYAAAMQTAAPQAPHAPEAAALPNRVVDTAAPSYPAAAPVANAPTITPPTVSVPTVNGGQTTIPAVQPPSGAAPAAPAVPAPVGGAAPAPAVPAPIQAPTAPAAAATATAVPTLQPPTVPAPPAAAAPTSYTVQHGDSLSKIARAMGGNWHQLYEANRATIGHNPNLIRPGQVLQLPAGWQQAHVPAPHVAHVPPAPVAHTVHLQVSAAPPVAQDPPVEIPAPTAIDAESPNIEGAAASPLVEKPTDVHEAQEQIERMSMVKNGGPDAVSAMQDALKMLPKDSPDYDHFRKTVDNYEAVNGPVGAPKLETPAAQAPAPVSTAPAPAAQDPAPVSAAPADPAPVAANSQESYGPTPQPSGGGAPAEVASRPVSRDELPEDPDGPPVGFY